MISASAPILADGNGRVDGRTDTLMCVHYADMCGRGRVWREVMEKWANFLGWERVLEGWRLDADFIGISEFPHGEKVIYEKLPCLHGS